MGAVRCGMSWPGSVGLGTAWLGRAGRGKGTKGAIFNTAAVQRVPTMPPLPFTPRDRNRHEHIGMLDRIAHATPNPARPWIILKLTDGATIVGPALATDFTRGQQYRFHGRWRDGRANYGPEFAFETFTLNHPLSETAVVTYLEKTCRNIGPAIATRLFAKYGGGAVRILREEPLTIANTGLLSLVEATEASQDLERFHHVEQTKCELFGIINGRGFPADLIDACIRIWGVQAPSRIRKNPFSLLVLRLPGCSFRRCDSLYIDLGKPADSLKRQALCGIDAIKRDRSGSTWIDADDIASEIRKAIPDADPYRALILLRRAQMIRVRRHDNRRYIATREYAAAEQRVADNFRRLTAAAMASALTGSIWPTSIATSETEGDGLPTAHQAAELRRATSGAVGCFIGQPGTGKTYALSFLLKQVIAEHGPETVAVAAPTGKASVRAGESLRARGLAIIATTQHRLLEIGRNGHDGDGWGFERNRNNPLDLTHLVIDEGSMDDVSLLADTLDAMPDGSGVLFVGDAFQLPPVGHGAPLRDLLASGVVPCGELTEIHRNAGSIVTACAAIKEGAPVRFDDKFDLDAESPKNLRLIDCRPEESVAVLADVIAAMGDSAAQISRFDPVWETQVITPLNDKPKSHVSRKLINSRFGRVLNPDGRGVKGNSFRVGDKIMCTSNTRLKAVVAAADRWARPDMALDAANYQPIRDSAGQQIEQYVANGEIGRVVAVSSSETIARFGGVDVPLVALAFTGVGKNRGSSGDDATGGGGDGDGAAGAAVAESASAGDFQPAWAVTAHKYQGSEVPCAIIMIDDEANSICDRNYWYTAISRARSACLLIGPRGVFEKQVKRVTLARRRTFLAELLREGL